jgi:hypothetical protein
MELEFTKKNQNAINEQSKIEHKNLQAEIEYIKGLLIKYQSELATQSTKLSLLEKEIAIFRTPHINLGGNINESVDLKASTSSAYRMYSSKLHSGVDNDNMQVNEVTSLSHNPTGNAKLEENLNF